jgi:cbb3-type cytochrome oxidase subunit 1
MFIKTSIVFFLVGCVWGAIQTLPSVREFIETGPAGIISGMHAHWNLLGWVSFAIIGAIYYLVPVITGKDLYSERLAKAHFWLYAILVIIGTALGVIAGYLGGTLFIEKRLAEIGPTIGPYMILITIIAFLEAIVANGLFAYIIYKTVRR